MIANTLNERRYGMTAAQAAGIIVACTLLFVAVLALVPDA